MGQASLFPQSYTRALLHALGLCRNSLSAPRQAIARPPAWLSLPLVPGNIRANPSCRAKEARLPGEGRGCGLTLSSSLGRPGDRREGLKSVSPKAAVCPGARGRLDRRARQSRLLPSSAGCRVTLDSLRGGLSRLPGSLFPLCKFSTDPDAHAQPKLRGKGACRLPFLGQEGFVTKPAGPARVCWHGCFAQLRQGWAEAPLSSTAFSPSLHQPNFRLNCALLGLN